MVRNTNRGEASREHGSHFGGRDWPLDESQPICSPCGESLEPLKMPPPVSAESAQSPSKRHIEDSFANCERREYDWVCVLNRLWVPILSAFIFEIQIGPGRRSAWLVL
jgi:hypothetical protein